MIEINIRPADLSELPAVLRLFAVLEFEESTHLDLKQAEAIFQRMAVYPDYHLYIVLDGEQVIGAFTLLIMDNLAHNGQPSGIVEDVAVHPRWQRKGVGRKMMEFAMQRCRKAGCYKLALTSNRERKAAHRFYEALGFHRHGYSYWVEIE